MTVFRRRVLLAAVTFLFSSGMAPTGPASVAVQAAAGLDTQGVPDSASLSAPVVATGRLVADAGDAGGTPVVLRAWPTATVLAVGDEVHAPVVAQTRTAGDGAFTLRSPLTPELARYAEANGGYVSLSLRTASGDEWNFSRYVGERATAATLSGGDSPVSWEERPGEPALPLTIEVAGGAPDFSAQHFCGHPKIVDTRRADTKIGEINGEGDTRKSTFVYGQGSSADSDISVAIKAPNQPWQINGEHHVGNGDYAEVGQYAGPSQSYWFTSGFDYHLLRDGCGVERVVPHGWRGGIQRHVQMNQGCTVEPHWRHSEDHAPGSFFKRDRNRSEKWAGAVKVFGVSLGARSGFSKHVMMKLDFGGAARHLVCGDDAVPIRSSRVFSGESSPV